MIRDGDRAESFGLCMVEEQRGRHSTVVRRARVSMEVDDDPVAVRKRICLSLAGAPAAAQPFVDVLQLACDVRERLLLGCAASRRGLPLAVRAVIRQPAHLRGCELGLLTRSGR